MNMNTSLVFLLFLSISAICEGNYGRNEDAKPDKIRRTRPGREEASSEVGQDAANIAPSAEKTSVNKEHVKGMLNEMEKKMKPYLRDAEESVMPSKAEMKQRLRKKKEQMHAEATKKYGRKVVDDADEKLIAIHHRKRSQKKDSEEVKAIRKLEEKVRSLHAEGRSEDEDVKELNKQLVTLRKRILREAVKGNALNKDNEEIKKMLEKRKARKSNVKSRQDFSTSNKAKNVKHGGQMKKPNRNHSPNKAKPIIANLG
ncbi:uncharacterized protein LOC111637710 [Centruroides sculpturatus]|uniref:uncharacterized protein LOC111637710 n=1 Tax=Centruroides sculpturatus TaxID=218467 RepID=UPI000C6D918B|nr:uncharacterized protein LOC111637710 [Centruroides sculpturatus]